jgi:hypothetical protein
MFRFTPALATLASEAAAQRRIAARVEVAVRNLGWPLAVVPQFCAVVDQTMRELPRALADAREAAATSSNFAGPMLTALATRLDALLPSDPASLADVMLERTYLGLRVLAALAGALSPHALLGLFAFHDILGPAVTGRLDSEIARTFPEVTLLPLALVADMLQREADALQRDAADRYAHPLYGEVATDEAVRLEVGRHRAT